MKAKSSTFIAVGAVVAIVLVAAGCGTSKGSGASYSLASDRLAANATGNGSARATKVGVRNTSLGRILVDARGRTLYLFEKDKTRRSTCYGPCAAYWPPLLSHGKPLAGHGVKRSLLGTTRRANGAKQVTYAGHPLYRYAGDSRSGDTTGEGLQDFGAVWDVVSPAGKQIEAGG
jgi:predicted lipoprotein with Yx(FWY)xxD motif